MSNNGSLVSIVLPVYNGEKYLAAAIQSVLSQTYSNWELLIVDDGSKDNSAAICDGFSVKNPRIKVFHQSNSGVNSARAKAVDDTIGDFLVFLDADDTLSPDALEYLVENYSDEDDLLVCGNNNQYLGKEDYIQQLWKGTIAPALWGKMFRASLFKQMDYAIDRHLVMGEDLLLNSMYALKVERVRVLPREVYLVNRDNESSVTRTFKHNWEYEKFYFSKVQELFLDKCSEWDSYEQIKLLVNKSWLNAMKYVMLDGGRIEYNDNQFIAIKDYFDSHNIKLSLSERLIFVVRNTTLYRLILNTYLNHIHN